MGSDVEKLFNKGLTFWKYVSEVKTINRKTLALSLILLTALSITVGALLITATASATTTDSNSTSTTGTSTTTSPALPDANQTMGMPPFMMNDQGFGGQQFGGRCGHGRTPMDDMMGTQNLEISSAYNSTIYSILTNDTDVAKLIAQGYNVTAIQPILHSIIGANGTVTTQASTANVLLQNGTAGFAAVKVDIANNKVTEIVIMTRTVITK